MNDALIPVETVRRLLGVKPHQTSKMFSQHGFPRAQKRSGKLFIDRECFKEFCNSTPRLLVHAPRRRDPTRKTWWQFKPDNCTVAHVGPYEFASAQDRMARFKLLTPSPGLTSVRIIRDYWTKEDGYRVRKGEVVYLPAEEAGGVIASGVAAPA